MIREFSLVLRLDQQGEPEGFSNDPFMIIPLAAAAHLDDSGLPSVGSYVHPGLLLIGRFGCSATFTEAGRPDFFERRRSSEAELIEKFGHMFYDSSLYVPDGLYGKVAEAYIEEYGQTKRAVVKVDVSDNTDKRKGKGRLCGSAQWRSGHFSPVTEADVVEGAPREAPPENTADGD